MAVEVPAQRVHREHQPVQVVVDVEVAREASAGELRLVPVAVGPLGLGQPGDAALDGVGRAAGGEQREQRPGRLRRGGVAPARPLAAQLAVLVGAQVLAPAAVRVLVPD